MTVSAPSLVDARIHATAVKAALNVALGPKAKAWDYDEVPGSPQNATESERNEPLPNIYVAITVSRMGGAPLRNSGTTGRTGWRVTARCVGRTVDECRWAMNRVEVGLNERRLTIDGGATTRGQFAPGQDPEWDDGRYSALALYTYVH